MIKNVTVAGGGVLGSQIAFQSAFFGCDVTLYDINEGATVAAEAKLDKLAGVYAEFFGEKEKADQARTKIRTTYDLADAMKDADLLIEAIPEVKDIKKDFYTKVAEVSPDKTIFATNSSTMVPSDFAEYTGRPEKFLALHFANEVWKNNTGEVMGHAGTDKKYEELLLEFAETIGLIPLHVLKEQPGYILNSLLVPFLEAGQMLLAKGVADVETIDRTWMAATGASQGPFAILDVVGLTTAYNISKVAGESNPDMKVVADMLKSDYIDKGHFGQATGRGFYEYPNPRYLAPDFVRSTQKL